MMDYESDPLLGKKETDKEQLNDTETRIAELRTEYDKLIKKLMAETEIRVQKIIAHQNEEIKVKYGCLDTELLQAGQKHSVENNLLACPNFVSFAEDALGLVSIPERTFLLFDEKILYAKDDDDLNYFYVRRRLKFLNSITPKCFQDIQTKWIGELTLLAEHGVVWKDSLLYKAIDGNPKQSIDTLRYYMYNALFHKLSGAILILLKEIQAISSYVDMDTKIDVSDFVELEAETKSHIKNLGYQVVDVQLFEPLQLSNEIDCVDKINVELPTESGNVYEIVKLAVNYGHTKEHSEVKVKL